MSLDGSQVTKSFHLSSKNVLHHAITLRVSNDVMETLVEATYKQLSAGLDKSDFRNERGETPLQTAVRLAESLELQNKVRFLSTGHMRSLPSRSLSEMSLSLNVSQVESTAGSYLGYANILYRIFVDVHDST